jgi:hypothetical protein
MVFVKLLRCGLLDLEIRFSQSFSTPSLPALFLALQKQLPSRQRGKMPKDPQLAGAQGVEHMVSSDNYTTLSKNTGWLMSIFS